MEWACLIQWTEGMAASLGTADMGTGPTMRYKGKAGTVTQASEARVRVWAGIESQGEAVVDFQQRSK